MSSNESESIADDQLRFDGQVAIVTGAARGLGRAHALALADRGARVVVNDRGGAPDGTGHSADPAAAVVDEIRAAGGEAIANDGSVVDAAGSIVGAAIDQWGRLDILINNAGIASGGSIADLGPDDVQRIFDVHVGGMFAMTSAAWPHLAERGGRVVNTSSPSVYGMPGTSPYISAKAAILGFTKAVALEGADSGIRVNAILPSAWTRLTALIPDEGFRALLEAEFSPERVATFVVYLCHPDVAFTGEAFDVEAGRVARVVFAEAGRVVLDSPTPEAYRARVGELLASTDVLIPTDTMDHIGHVVADIQHRWSPNQKADPS